MKLLDTRTLPLDHPAIVPDFWTRAILSDRRVSARYKSKVLQEAGLPSFDTGQDLPVTQNHEAFVLERLSAMVGDPLFAAKAAMDHNPRRGTILTYISLSTATGRDFLTMLVRYLPVTRNKAMVSVEFAPDIVKIKLGNKDPLIEQHPDHVEFATGAILNTINAAVGTPLHAQIQFKHASRPVTDLTQIYGCPVTANTGTSEIWLPASSMEKPVLSADDKLLRHLRAYADILLKKRRDAQSGIREEIEDVVLPRLSQGVPSLDDVAAVLGLSSRTLSRRLAEAGLTFRQVLETLRQDLAQHYLADPALPLAEIAFLLGFSDQSSFGTAFRRWTGETPRGYRVALNVND
jgi:AraC-like DNA-binding protein